MALGEHTTQGRAIQTRGVAFEDRHGVVSGFLAAPDADVWTSAVVVVADRDGVDEHIRGVCRDLAANGHAALGMALSVPLDSLIVRPRASRVTLARCTTAVSAGLAFLRSAGPTVPERAGVVGYGSGALVALAAGYRCQVGAAVSFYGEGPMWLSLDLGHIIDRPKRHAGSLLFLVGGEDDDIRPAGLGAIREHLSGFGMRHTFIVYPRTKGDFCRSESPTYRPAAAQDAWGRMLQALETSPKLRHRFATRRA